MKKVFAFLVVLLFSVAQAHEVKCLRAKYQTDDLGGWSRNHNVQAHILSGSELNEYTYRYHTSFKYYAVIPWRDNKVSIIEMQNFYSPGGMIFGMRGIDQNGVQWKLDDAYGICY